ncbi:O-glucosyltransferase rumi-like [Hibiscus syriacus]|nr:O-glucosyltransferase rumi-like [Hibiscus syriacus]
MAKKQAWVHSSHPRSHSNLFFLVVALSVFSLIAILIYKVDNFASQTKTIVGHNLEPTPWHLFEPKNFTDESRHTRAHKIIHCSYLACPYAAADGGAQPSKLEKRRGLVSSRTPPKCPAFFKFIYRDLEPWLNNRISMDQITQAKEHAAFRIVIVEGKLFVDLYYACVQSRMMFTLWGILQLLKKYPGMVPDVDIMFDCMDKPSIERNQFGNGSLPVPLFRYCTTEAHLDIPFPDWSFWGWSEVNIKPWDEQFKEIKRGSRAQTWVKKIKRAYWKGNPDVQSPIRTELMGCNDSSLWGTEIIRQNWTEEAKAGYERSKLSNQCKHRYKIYAEGYAWSVSLKYILSCGSLPLIISPQYEDFFSRVFIPKLNYWPVSSIDVCRSIRFAVDWGNSNPSQAQAIGRRAQQLMQNMSMDQVYHYMFHLISEYAKLQDFKPVVPPSAQQVCEESLLCFADEKQKELLKKSAVTSVSTTPPCTLTRSPNPNFFTAWAEKKQKIIDEVKDMENRTNAAAIT